MIDQMVLLSDFHGRYPQKTIYRDPLGKLKVLSYPSMLVFYVTPIDFDNFDDFAALIGAAERDGRYFAIRGQPIADYGNTPVRRLLHADDNTPPSFTEGTHRWVMVDIDKMPNTIGTPVTAEESACMAWMVVRDALPNVFHNSSFYYQWSSSMGLYGWDLLNLHLFFLLDNPLPDTTLGQWATQLGTIDESVYRSVQPNYLALPYHRRVAEVLPRHLRSGIWRGDIDTVDLHYDMQDVAIMNENMTREIIETQKLWRASGKSFLTIDAHNPKLSAPMRRIAEIGVNGRLHMPITRSAASWITCCGEFADREKWKDLVRERVMVSGHHDAIARSSDKYLNAAWRSAQRKYTPNNPKNWSVPPELLINKNLWK